MSLHTSYWKLNLHYCKLNVKTFTLGEGILFVIIIVAPEKIAVLTQYFSETWQLCNEETHLNREYGDHKHSHDRAKNQHW